MHSVVHNHSKWATIFTLMNVDIPCLRTTHADNFYGIIPHTGRMTEEEIKACYEKETETVIVEIFREGNIVSYSGSCGCCS